MQTRIQRNTKACTNAHKHANTSTALTCEDVPWRLVREDVGKVNIPFELLHIPHRLNFLLERGALRLAVNMQSS